MCGARKQLTLPYTLFLESRFTRCSVIVFNCFNDLQLCKCSPEQSCASLNVCEWYELSSSLHTSFPKLQHWFIPQQRGDLRPPGHFWRGSEVPTWLTGPVWEELEILCRKFLLSLLQTSHVLGPCMVLWGGHDSVSLSQLVPRVVSAAASFGMALHEVTSLLWSDLDYNVSKFMFFLNMRFPGILNYILWLVNRNISIFFLYPPKYISCVLLQDLFWLFLHLLFLCSSI